MTHRLRSGLCAERGRRERGGVKHRLQWQIFGALAMTGALCVALAMLVGTLLWDEQRGIPPFVHGLGTFIVADLPKNDPPRFARELRERARRLDASLSVWDQEGRLTARAGRKLPFRTALAGKRGAVDFEKHTAWVVLDDGRTLALSFNRPAHSSRFLYLAVAALLGALLLGSHAAARRITRRLKLLQDGVTRFGQGDLQARVAMGGRDEIAVLAQAFNHSSERIAGLVQQQRRMLQSASHELRSPLARLRMALELLAEPGQAGDLREKLRADASRDVEELDQLIGDLLLAARLTDSELPRDFGAVVLAPLLREEAARVNAEVQTEELSLPGNARMLRSLVRNLLENARRYGKDPVRLSAVREGNGILLCIDDAGPGIAESERERIFEPFYRPPKHRETQDGGVGLGLALVKSIAEHHGGSVRYVPLDQGSRFEIRLPG